MDPTELRTEVQRLVTKAVDLPARYPYADRDAFIAAMVDAANTLDDIDRILAEFDEQIEKALARAGAVTKRCDRPGCGRLIVQPATGRPRLTCSGACRTAVWRA